MQTSHQCTLEQQQNTTPSHGFWLTSYIWLSALGSMIIIGLCIESTPILHWIHSQVVIAITIIEQITGNLLPTLSMYGIKPSEFNQQLQMIENASYTISTGLLTAYGMAALVNVLGCMGVWYWKKWGVFATYLSMVLAFITNYYTGFSVYHKLLHWL